MTMGFRMVRKPSIWTPLKLSFSLVFFPSVTARLADAAGSNTLTRNRPRLYGLGIRTAVHCKVCQAGQATSVCSHQSQLCISVRLIACILLN